MSQCYVPCCNHRPADGYTCRLYRFPTDELNKRRWARIVGHARQPTHTSRICGCHFPKGKERGPILFMNKDGTICKEHEIPKYSLTQLGCPGKKTCGAAESPSVTHNVPPVKSVSSVESISTDDGTRLAGPMVLMETNLGCNSTPEGSICYGKVDEKTSTSPVEPADITMAVLTKICPSVGTQTDTQASFAEVEKNLLQAELKNVKEELGVLNMKLANFQNHYTPSRLSDEVVKVETGLPDRDCFNKIVECAMSLKNTISYHAGVKIACLSIQEQVFLTLMKLRHNYKAVHLGALFSCSHHVIKTVIKTWRDILQALLQKDYATAPSSSNSQRNPVDLSESNHALDTNIHVGSAIASNFLKSTRDHPLDTNLQV